MAVPDAAWYENELRIERERLEAAWKREAGLKRRIAVLQKDFDRHHGPHKCRGVGPANKGDDCPACRELSEAGHDAGSA